MHTPAAARAIRFGPFQVDPLTRELRKGSTRLRVPEQSVRILLALLDRSGDVVGREELAAILWPTETLVDVEHGLNSAVRRLRDALGDSAERPAFIETVPRVGYRFVGTVDTPAEAAPEISDPTNRNATGALTGPADELVSLPAPVTARSSGWSWLVAATAVVLVSAASIVAWKGRKVEGTAAASRPEPFPLTFDGGLQTDPSISPDGQWVAYASDNGGSFDIWLRRLSGGDAVRVTHDRAADSQPDWSPDGSRLVFRSERAGGGLFIVPVTGGAEQKITDAGFRPRWSPDSDQILFAERIVTGLDLNLSVFNVRDGAVHRWPGSAVGAFGWEPRSSTVLKLASLAGPFEPTLMSWVVGTSSVDRWEVADDVTRGFRAQQLIVIGGEEVMVPPEKSSLYFVGASRGRQALWRLDIDPVSRRVVAGPQRITTLPDANHASLSPDGRRVVFDGSPGNAQVFAYPLDGDGRPAAEPAGITSEATHAASPTLSRDGRAFAVVLTRPGSPDRSELTARWGSESRLRTIRVIDHPREVVGMPRWNSDGTRLAYSLVSNANESSAQQQLRLFNAVTGEDAALTSAHPATELMEFPTGWTPDGRELIMTSTSPTGQTLIARVPVAAAPAAERSRRLITSSADEGLSLGTMSPDGRWIAFRVGQSERAAPRIAVVAAAGGGRETWTFITSGIEAADKPCWSDDGATLYYTSGNQTMNVLGVKFDTRRGQAIGEPFRVTNFSGPGTHVYSDIRNLELAIGGRRLAVPLVRPKGALWTLELQAH